MAKQSTNRSAREKQNKKIAESRKATRNLEKTHHPDPIEIKITDNNPHKCEKLTGMRKQAKYLHNYMLSESRENDTWFGDIDIQALTTVPVRNPITEEYDDRELGLLGTHVRNAIRDQLIENVKGLSEAKKKGRKVGSLKFENSHGSVGLKQYGVDYYFNKNFTRVHITKLGWFSCRGAEVLKDRKIIKSAKLCWRADGVYVIATTWLTPDEWKEARAYEKKKVKKTVQSIDFNVGEPIKDSSDNTFDLIFEEPRALRRARRKLARQKKGSNGYHKMREKIAFLAQKNSYREDDAANKVCSYYMRNDMLIIQDDNLNAWKKKDSAAHGSKKIHAGILGRVKAKLAKYPGTVVLDSYVPTTRSCPICGEKTETPLGMDTFTCSYCGHTAPRDLHAAWNMDYFARKNGAGEIPLWYQELVISDDVEATLAQAVDRAAHSESGLRIDSVHELHDLLGHADLPKSAGKRKRSKNKVLRGAWVSSRVARGKRDKWSGRSKAYDRYVIPKELELPVEFSGVKRHNPHKGSSAAHESYRAHRQAVLHVRQARRNVECDDVRRASRAGGVIVASSLRKASRERLRRESLGVPFVWVGVDVAYCLEFLCTRGMRGINAGGEGCKTLVSGLAGVAELSGSAAPVSNSAVLSSKKSEAPSERDCAVAQDRQEG